MTIYECSEFDRMPKLSLKKSSQTGPPKSQKSITSFFKKPNVEIAKSLENDENQSTKRKANSPIKNSEENKTEFIKHLPKKLKLHNDSSNNISKSSNKETNYNHISPKKQSMIISKSPISDHKGECSKWSPETHATNKTGTKDVRIPLSPVKTDINNAENSCYPVETCNDQRKNDVKLHCKSPTKNSIRDYSKQSPQKSSLHNMEMKVERLLQSPVKTDNYCNTGKSCIKSLFTEKKEKTPVKKSPEKNHVFEGIGSQKNWTPKKSPFKEYICSPSKAGTEGLIDVLSPSKSGSTASVKTLDVDTGDAFDDEWDIGDIEENETEDIDLSSMQRCEIQSVKHHGSRIELKLKNAINSRTTCFVEGVWLDTPLTQGDTISVLASRDASGQYCVGNSAGLLVLRPDHLISSTSVVAGVFCKRKAVLQERWRGIDSANTAMTIGIIIHELVQKALTQHIASLEQLRIVAELILKESVQMLYDAGLSEEEARTNIQTYVPPLAEFMQSYVFGKQMKQKPQKDKNNWQGRINKVLDIEENLCCPQLGLKGKIDATLEVTIHDRKAIVPLELKSGKASVSAEHRGQLVLYGMMLSLQRNEDPTVTEQKGLLLYLRDRVDLREVSCGYPERRDLIMLRNQLVQYLARGPEDVDPEQLVDIEDASALLQQRLPEPVHHETACAKCPYLTLCSLHLWHTDGPKVSPTHPLSKLQGSALGHLSPEHIKYFFHWTSLLKMEERGQMATSPLHALWTDSAEKRAKRGTCAANLKLQSVKQSVDRFLHVFVRQNDTATAKDNKPPNGPQENEFSIVSIENRPWIAAGVVSLSNQKEIHILLERDVSRRLNIETYYHIDTYESYATTVQNLTNLGVLMEDSDRAERLRRLIMDKEPAQFDMKLPREVGRLGSKLMKSLNIEQQRAVLKAITAKDYALLQGLPGTGKTQTISVLIQMLVGLKQRVLVTAHTHSAVDTVLTRLPDSLNIIRLGSAARVAPSLLKRTEQSVLARCETLEQLISVYDSMDVVGVTCLGAAHALLTRTEFDVVIVDEATQVLQCTVLRPLFAAKKFVLVGDPEQLPPVVRSKAARRLGMEESLFHRLMSDEATCTLGLQYRMNQALADIANKVAYNNRLKCATEKIARATLDVDERKLKNYADKAWLQAIFSKEPDKAAIFLDVPTKVNESENKTLTNEDEARVVIAIVEALKTVGIKSVDIGVIAPYRDQVSLLRRCLTQYSVEVSTVDQFQGRDKSVILYSCTRRDHDDRKVKEGEVLNDQRRLAVSVTRAKHKFVLIGNSNALQKYKPLQRLINACMGVKLEQSVMDELVKDYSNVS